MVNLSDFASVIVRNTLGSPQTYERDVQLLGNEMKTVNRDVALAELFNLRAFVVAYAAERFLRSDEVKREFRDVYARILHNVLKGSDDPRVRTNPNVLIDEMNRRIAKYMEAVATPYHLGPAWNVGKVFCRLCSGEKEGGLDATVAAVGSLEFMTALLSITDFLRECKSRGVGDFLEI